MPPQLDAITTAHIEAWFTSRNEKPATRASNIGRLSALFTYAVKHGWLDKSPMTALDKVRIPNHVPAILDNSTAQRLLDNCPSDFLPYIALGLFCGVRPEEAQRLKPADILLDRRLVRIGPEVSKVGHQRYAPIPDNAAPMLATYPAMSRITIRRRKRKLARAMGWAKWPQDILRHTAISNWVALTGDIGKVATQMGNSTRIIQRHYHQLVDQQAAKVFFSLTPNHSLPCLKQ